jgi:O-methyltransferase
VIQRLVGPIPYFRFGLNYIAKLRSGFVREVALDQAMEYIGKSGVEGDYLEFGVWQGRTFSAACFLARKKKLDMNFYAFDSFRGVPSNDEVDATGHQPFKGGDYSCNEGQFLKNVRGTGANMKRVTTVPGWFEDSLRPDNPLLANLRKAAVVWVDCDLYSSACTVLDFVTPYLQHGTLVFFDDWFLYRADPNAGEQRAFREWLERNPHFSAVEMIRVGWHGTSFIIHTAGAESSIEPQRLDCITRKAG